MTTAMRTPKSCHEITSGTKEWADYNVNCIKGCFNNCRYCYAKMMAKRFGRTNDDTWKNMIINPRALEKNYRKYDGRVMFPSTHDIIDEPSIIDACCNVIQKLLSAGNQLLITSKPHPTVIEIIMRRFATQKEQIQFRFTITSLDNQLLSFWEPNAPTIEQRLASLQLSYEAGFRTSVSIEPFLDEVPQLIVSKLSQYVTESIWLGPMNYIPRKIISEGHLKEYDEIKRISRYDNLLCIYEDLMDIPRIRFKDSMINRLGLV